MDLKRTAKEAARHFLHRTGLRRPPAHAAGGDRRERFEAIYKDGIWSYGRDDVPLSGEGSSLEATEDLRAAFPDLLRTLGARSLLDVGCGDFTWMSQIDLPCDYIGVDIVPHLMEENQKTYGSPSRRFLVTDAVRDTLPKADVVLCREVLFHLSLRDAIAALRNMLATGCTHIVLTSDSETLFNADIQSGDFRILNLRRSPFRLGKPIQKIDDAAVGKTRFIGVWEAAKVTAQLS
ncbi:MAG: class I SAM-dependent methyltransferase [Sphingomonas sp.]|uniref:class I SAM-dependent methyltransferase n=1 Tax=Sphingomonas sp. TaxID=28214 RepID=UPI003565E6E9